MEECLVYFRAAIHAPLTVPPWSEWWAANVETVERTFPLIDYVRLKHRKLLGARQILQYAGELPSDYVSPSPQITGSCAECGERTTFQESPSGGEVICPTCGVVEVVV